MDRALKERVTGAVVLVVIAILVVPVFLDGAPTDAEIVSETVTLPGQSEQRRKQQTIVLERDRDQPVPATTQEPDARAAAVDAAPSRSEAKDAPSESVAAARPEPQPAEQRPAPQEQPKKAPQEQPQTPPAQEEKTEPTQVAQVEAEADSESATGMWAVQLGSFSEKDNAERLAGALRTNGYAAFLSRLNTSDGSLHRVRVGPQKDRDGAEAVARRLSGDGHDGQVVPHP